MTDIGEDELAYKITEHMALEHYDDAMKDLADPHGEGAKLMQDIRRLHSRYKGNEVSLKLDKSNPRELLETSRTLRLLHKYDEAIKCCDLLIKAYPYLTWGWQSKGMTLHDMKRYDEAIKCYDEVLRLDPDDHQTLNDKGIACSESGRDEDAIKCFDESLNLEQNYVWSWVNKYMILYRLGKLDDAQECKDRAIQLGWSPPVAT